MKNNFFYQKPLANIYANASKKSEIVSQILYGEKFVILKKRGNWCKIKTDYDNYIGYLKNDNFLSNFKPTHKVYKLNTVIYKKVKKRFIPSGKSLYFATRIFKTKSDKKFIQFDKNKWIKKKDLKPINYIEKRFSKILKLFLNIKYLWGGKSSNGIDCSALVQIYYLFNNIYFPRDTKDQIKFLKKRKRADFNKRILLYWKGHVAVCLNKNTLIHAYGPKKRVVIMKKDKTIDEIRKNTNLELKKL